MDLIANVPSQGLSRIPGVTLDSSQRFAQRIPASLPRSSRTMGDPTVRSLEAKA